MPLVRRSARTIRRPWSSSPWMRPTTSALRRAAGSPTRTAWIGRPCTELPRYTVRAPVESARSTVGGPCAALAGSASTIPEAANTMGYRRIRMATASYTRGLHELGDGLFAYLQPDGGWGLSNAGLVAGDGASLLVDTLFDLKLTQEMLDAMAPVTGTRPIESLFNTHGNGDHCWGNQLVDEGTRIYATQAAVENMRETPPELLRTMVSADLGEELNDFAEYAFGNFDFEGVELREPGETFTGSLELEVGGRRVEVSELGPAHTDGDAIAYVPEARVAFTGDLLFIGGTPIVWANLSGWLAACDRLTELDVDVLVPGHGPISDKQGAADVRRYLE